MDTVIRGVDGDNGDMPSGQTGAVIRAVAADAQQCAAWRTRETETRH